MTIRRHLTRIGLAVGTGIALLVTSASPAAAHNVSGVGATNYETTLDDVSPAVDGVTVKVIESGSRLELTNDSDADVIVLGYEDEPYLRIGPDGVFENKNSPATYLNRSRTGSDSGPASVNADADPDWDKVSDAHTARWHDHRIHWMGGTVTRPDRRFVVQDWTVPILQGDTRIEATGRLLWVPGPSPLPWYVFVAGLVVVGALAGLASRWGKYLAVTVIALIAADVIHTVGILGASVGGSKLSLLVPGSIYSIVAWIVGGVAARLLWRGKTEGLFAALFAAVLLAVFGGLADLGVLGHSQVPFAWSPLSARFLVSATLGLGLGVIVGCGLALWRTGALAAAADEEDPTGTLGAMTPGRR